MTRLPVLLGVVLQLGAGAAMPEDFSEEIERLQAETALSKARQENAQAHADVGAAEAKLAAARLDAEEQVAVLESGVLTARRDILTYQLPSAGPINKKSGAITLGSGDSAPAFYGQRLAFQSLDPIAEIIAEQTRVHADQIILTVEPELSLAKQRAAWQLLGLSFDKVGADVDRVVEYFTAVADEVEVRRTGEEAADALFTLTSGLTAVNSILGAAADIAALFRVDVDFATAAVASDNLAVALEATLAEHIGRSRVIMPGNRVRGSNPFIQRAKSLLNKRDNLIGVRERIRSAIAKRAQVFDSSKKVAEEAIKRGTAEIEKQTKELKETNASLLELKTQLESLPAASSPDALTDPAHARDEISAAVANEDRARIQAEIDRLSDQIARITTRIGMLEEAKKKNEQDVAEITRNKASLSAVWGVASSDIGTALTSVQEVITRLYGQDGGSGLLAKLALVAAVERNPKAAVLSISIAKGGVEMEKTSSLWNSGTLSFLGGAVATYFLTGPSDNILASGVVPMFEAERFKARRGITIQQAEQTEAASATASRSATSSTAGTNARGSGNLSLPAF